MSCYNKNTNEYKALQEIYANDIAVDFKIDTWQKITKSDIIPSVEQIKLMESRQREQYNLKTGEFKDMVLANLSRAKIISKYENNYWVNSSIDKGTPWARYSAVTLNNNLKRLQSQLSIWGISQDIIKYKEVERYNIEKEKFERLVVIEFNENAVTPRDMIVKDNNKDMTHIGHILDHMQSVFPQVKVEVLNEKEAERIYEDITYRSKGKRPPFDQVNSFYHNGRAVLIEGRVTSETAVEEVLHPFINHLQADKPELFRQLLSEAKKNFPLLNQEIIDSYTDRRNFNQNDRNLELVTQALSRHFKKEYETTPTKGWLQKVFDLVQWLSEFIKDIYQYATDGKLKLKPGMINDKATLTDIAKLLNTADLTFDLDFKNYQNNNNKIQFKLSKDKQNLVNHILKHGTPEQKEVIKRLTNDIIKQSKTYNFIAANPFIGTDTPLVIINSKTHTYTDIKSGEVYASTTEKIKGKMTSDEFKFNVDIGNDFDDIMEAVVIGKPWEQTKKNFNFERINEEQAKYIYEGISAYVQGLLADGSILVPQVVVADPATKIAGTIDLLLVRPDGSVRVIDLKTSKNSINDRAYSNTQYTVGKESVFYDPENPDAKVFTTRTQHSLQVNTYRRMLANMGYTLESSRNDDNTAFTIHIKVDINTNVEVKIGKDNYVVTFDSNGKIISKNVPKEVAKIARENLAEGKGEKEYIGFKFEGLGPDRALNTHSLSANKEKVDKLVPINKDTIAKEQIWKKFKKDGTRHNHVKDDDFLSDAESIAESELIANKTYENIYDTLNEFVNKLLTRRQAIERMKNSAKLLKSKEEVLTNIDFTISAINTALRAGQADIVFSEILEKTIEDIEEFEEYLNDDENASQREYISKINNFQGLVDSMRGLANLKKIEGLSDRQTKLMVKLQAKLNDLNGVTTQAGAVIQTGIINEKIELFVAKLIQNESRRNWTMDDLIGEDGLLKFGKDIGLVSRYARDMSTQADTILQLMDKLYKRQKQKTADLFENRNKEIRRVTTKLAYLSKDKNNIDYSFMLVKDEDGNFTGRYVKKIGNKYYDRQRKIREPLYNEAGEWKKYIYNANGSYTKEELDYNKKLYKDRLKYREFMQAEKYEDGKLKDGKYHSYSTEFKQAREKFEIFIPWANGKGGRWQKRDDVTAQEYEAYLVRWKEASDYQQAQYNDQNEFNGTVQPTSDFFVKRKHVVVNERVDNIPQGEDMTDDKWRAIQNPQTELEKAEKEFYDTFIKIFEGELLRKLPPGVRDQMLGRVPVIKDTMMQSLKEKGPLFTRLYGKLKNGWKKWWHNTSRVKKVVLDENGEITDTMPLFFIGTTRTKEKVSRLEKKIEELDKAWNQEKNQTPKKQKKYEDEKKEMEQAMRDILDQPEAYELSQDMGDSLIRFSAMAEHYETMDEVGDTLNAMLKILEGRSYEKASGQKLVARVGGVLKRVGIKSKTGLEEPKIVQRARKWMKMTYYDNDQEIRGKLDKMADGLLNLTSLTYVGFNPFGNFNNYMVGRLSNAIESIGGRYFEQGAYHRAIGEFNKRMVPDMIQRVGQKSWLADKIRAGKASIEEYKITSKYEGMVDYFRMMDQKADIREATRSQTGKESGVKKIMEWGYILQDAAEYNVQTKVGMAITMSLMVKNDKGDTMSLYDALEFNSETGEMKLKEGYNKVQKVFSQRKKESLDVKNESQWIDYNDNARYDIRNYIREVNKIIHGNYAHEDRTVMQANALGRLVMQFHKWVVPTFSARWRKEYYDENLGWVEGRYLTAWSFLKYFGTNIKDFGNIIENYKKEQGEKGQVKIDNLKRNLADAGVIALSFLLRTILLSLWDDEDEDKALWRKQAENVILYQLDRQKREFFQFIWAPDLLEMTESPYAAHRAATNLWDAMTTTFGTFTVGVVPSVWGSGMAGEDFWLNKDYVYQRTKRKGQLKMVKRWKNTIPLLYTIEKLKKYETMRDFYVK